MFSSDEAMRLTIKQCAIKARGRKEVIYKMEENDKFLGFDTAFSESSEDEEGIFDELPDTSD